MASLKRPNRSGPDTIVEVARHLAPRALMQVKGSIGSSHSVAERLSDAS